MQSYFTLDLLQNIILGNKGLYSVSNKQNDIKIGLKLYDL